jgi:Mg2+/Co2+ transporter CorB
MSGGTFLQKLAWFFVGQPDPDRSESNDEDRSSPPRENGNRTTRERPIGWAELDEREIADILIHRTRMRAINADDPPEVSVRAILDSPFTRLPMWRGSTDNIIGVIHSKDLLRALAEPGATPEKLDIVRIADRPWFVPDTTSLREQLNAFLKRNTHFAIVVDEYGDMQGMVTMQDILEDVLGDMADEREVGLSGVRKEADGSIVVDGAVSIRDLNRAMGWSLPDSEATTIAGLVIHESRSIPDERQAFTFHGKRFIVMKRVKNRITRLRIRPAVENGASK